VGQDALVASGRDVERVRAAYEATAPRLWRAVVAFAGSTTVADDAVAEAFAQALRRGDAVVDVSRWVWRAAFAIARGALSSRSGDAAPDERPAVDDGTLVDLLTALAELPAADRELLVLRYVGGWTPAELGALLGVPAATIRVRLHRARARARPLFEEET
jgi:RNA polymerase sigma-70 factor (ECF subfamily)